MSFQPGNPGGMRPVGDDRSELRIHTEPGYRVYYVQRGSLLLILLRGGDKATSEQGIAPPPRKLARDIE